MEKLIFKIEGDLKNSEIVFREARRNLKLAQRNNQKDIKNLEIEFWNARNNLKLLRRKFLYLTKPDDLYSDYNYWKRHGSMRNWEIKLGKALVPIFNIKNAVDFGCGLGSYLEGLILGGVEKVRGFDLLFNTTKEAIPEGIRQYISYGNAGESIDCGKWDCAISIEVAEHLIEEQADIFVDNLVNASERIVILTASNAGGKYHINRQPKIYWINKLEDRCWKYSENAVNKLFSAWQRSGCPNYILTNLMVFYKNE